MKIPLERLAAANVPITHHQLLLGEEEVSAEYSSRILKEETPPICEVEKADRITPVDIPVAGPRVICLVLGFERKAMQVGEPVLGSELATATYTMAPKDSWLTKSTNILEE